MSSFVKLHSQGTAASATSVATALTSTVSAGRTLIAVTQNAGTAPNGGQAGTGLTKPGDESASWVKVGEVTSTDSTADNRATLAVWAIITTVPWASGTNITASWANASTALALSVSEYDGVSTTVIGSDDDSGNEISPTTLNVDTGNVLLPDDTVFTALLLQANNLSSSNTSGGTASVGSSSSIATVLPNSSIVRAFVRSEPVIAPGNRTASLTKASSAKRLLIFGLRALNYPPNAPALTSMADGGTVNRGITQRASHVFSDPVTSDSQSKFDLRYRLIGAGSWTTVTQTTPNQFYDFPAGSLAAGDYERQVRTYDSVGVVGPYSTSGFFTAADAPDGPTITDPVNAETIIVPANAFTWSAPDQDAYQVRKVADDTETPGTPDTSTVYYDSGEVIDTTTRTVQLNFPVNGRTEHLQVRVKFDDLWSDWASIVVDVDYAAPPVPVVELSTDIATGSLLVTITNPAPDGEDPAASYNEVFVDDGNGEERRATAVPPNTSWRYWLPVSGRDYSTAIRVVAVASSGATASSV